MMKLVDQFLFRVERTLIVFAVVAMTILVFLDVVQRSLSHIIPLGIPGAQKLALGLMMWASFLGASLATREHQHISLDGLRKKIPQKYSALVTFISNIVTAAFVFYLARLACFQFLEELNEWSTNEGVGLFDALPIPTWTVTLALPFSLVFIGLRFLIHAFDGVGVKVASEEVAT